MRIHKKSTFIFVLLVLGGLYIGFSSTQTASGVGTLNADVKPGNTYYFDVTEFPSFQDLIDLSGVNDNSNVTLSATGGLQGSSIYAKVIDTGSSLMRYWDGSTWVSASAPVTDLSVGMITGNQISLTATNNSDGSVIADVTYPAGLGIPVPVIFGTTSYINVSDVGNAILPVPFALNNDYVIHETVLTQLVTALPGGAGQVTNDASQLKIAVQNVPLNENNTEQVTGHIIWDKSDGVVQEVNLQFWNNTANAPIFTIDIDRNSADFQYNPINVAVGDHYELEVTAGDFNPSTSGFDPVDDPIGDMMNAKQMLNDQVGDIILEFDVVEVDGMYYRIEGTIPNPDPQASGRIQIGGPGDEIWMVGFGRYGPGMPLPVGAMDYYSTPALREQAVVGPIISHDTRIYQAWDATLAAILTGSTNVFVEVLEILEEEESDQFQIWHSSGADVPKIDTSFTSSASGDIYSYGLSVDVDFKVWTNESYENYYYYEEWNGTHYVPYEGYEYYERYDNTTVVGQANLDVTYDKTHFSSLRITGGFTANHIAYNSTQVWENANIGISNFIFEITGTYQNVQPEPSGEDGPGLPFGLPGFDAYLTIFGITIVGLITRRRRH